MKCQFQEKSDQKGQEPFLFFKKIHQGQSRPYILESEKRTNVMSTVKNPYSQLQCTIIAEQLVLYFSSHQKQLENWIKHIRQHRIISREEMTSLRKGKQMRKLFDCPGFLPKGTFQKLHREREPKQSLAFLLS